MSDLILIERLDALKKNLLKESRNANYWQRFKFNKLGIDSGSVILEGICQAIRHEADLHLGMVKSIRTSLSEEGDPKDASDAWREYTRVYRQSRKFFSECLEVVGGLTFRNIGLDTLIYKVADELMKKCKIESGLSWGLSPTVPALPETMIKTLARVIGLGFPEWTIWSLPFTAHELGHVMTEELQPSGRFADKLVGMVPKEQRAHIKNHIDEFLADAFATYTMGPAYVCAAIRLGFNPLTAHKDTPKCPANAKRAHVLLAILDKMYDGEAVSPFDTIRELIVKDWHGMLEQVGQLSELRQDERDFLDQLVGYIWEFFGEYIYDSAKYFYGIRGDGAYGWGKAEDWCKNWTDQPEHFQELPKESTHVEIRHTLRDVLNAAWLCRLTTTLKCETIEKCAENLCSEIIQMRIEEAKKVDEGTQNMIHRTRFGGQS